MRPEPSPADENESYLISYLNLRKAVGIIGTALPFALAFGKMLVESPGIEPSISSYYHTRMGDVFVGSLCAIGVFLFSYRGPERKDDIAGTLACVFAVGVALFPTSRGDRDLIGTLHLVCAGLFFLTLAYFSLVLFRKTSPTRHPTQRKLQRNVVYAVCGYVILASIGLIVGVHLVPEKHPVHALDPVFWLESAAVLAFGVSWLTKGEAILGDRNPPRPA